MKKNVFLLFSSISEYGPYKLVSAALHHPHLVEYGKYLVIVSNLLVLDNCTNFGTNFLIMTGNYEGRAANLNFNNRKALIFTADPTAHVISVMVIENQLK